MNLTPHNHKLESVGRKSKGFFGVTLYCADNYTSTHKKIAEDRMARAMQPHVTTCVMCVNFFK